jgi:type IV pilus assembly protein PilV
MTARPGGQRPVQRGLTLLDALISLAVLAFGLLGLSQMQTRMLVQATESQQRMTASLLADELLNTMLVDSPNARCYSLPAAGACGNAAARARADEWRVRALSVLPGATDATAVIDANSRMTVTLTWQFKNDTDPRMHQVTSDIRSN